jgi:hypothetical protein
MLAFNLTGAIHGNDVWRLTIDINSQVPTGTSPDSLGGYTAAGTSGLEIWYPAHGRVSFIGLLAEGKPL